MIQQNAAESLEARESYKWHDFIPAIGLINYPLRNEESFNPENNPQRVLVRQAILLAYNAVVFASAGFIGNALEKIASQQ